MDDGMDDFQHATVEIASGRYVEATKLLRSAEMKAADAKPAGPVAEIVALRQMCEAKLEFGA